MKQSILLDKNWKLSWNEYRGKKGSPQCFRAEKSIPAGVPGDVHLDLREAGIIPDLYYGMNLDHVRWIEEKDWYYKNEFKIPESFKGKKLFLIFHGLDTFATVWLNGQLVGSINNMFLSLKIDITSSVRFDSQNELYVRLASPAYSIEIDRDHCENWTPQRVFARKAQMSFGWDIAPRLITIGIWRPVEFVALEEGYIDNLYIHTLSINNGSASVRIQGQCYWFGETASAGVIKGSIGDTAFEFNLDLSHGVNDFVKDIIINNPILWWPRGYGAQYLYDTTVFCYVQDKIVDTCNFKTGIRKIYLIEKEQPSGATSFRFEVNGKNIFITGFNWTPLDAIFAAISDEQYTEMLEKLAHISCNMLRVWGGGIYEPQHFYQECDRLGILVWQEFMMACAWFPQNKNFCKIIENEAREIIFSLRKYTSLALWCGDNEVALGFPDRKNRLTDKIVRRICKELDPGRPYLPSSPYSPLNPAAPNATDQGDVHHYDHGQDYNNCTLLRMKPRFLSEFGCLSFPSMEVVKKFFPDGSEWPVTSPMWAYHGTDTNHSGIFRGAGHIQRAISASGFSLPDNIEDAINLSQELQAKALIKWIGHFAEDPEFGGFLIWNVKDCWPQCSDAVIDYLNNPKRVFYKLGELFQKLQR